MPTASDGNAHIQPLATTQRVSAATHTPYPSPASAPGSSASPSMRGCSR